MRSSRRSMASSRSLMAPSHSLSSRALFALAFRASTSSRSSTMIVATFSSTPLSPLGLQELANLFPQPHMPGVARRTQRLLHQPADHHQLSPDVIWARFTRGTQVSQVQPSGDPPLPHGGAQLSIELLVVGEKDEPLRPPLLVLAENSLRSFALLDMRWSKHGILLPQEGALLQSAGPRLGLAGAVPEVAPLDDAHGVVLRAGESDAELEEDVGAPFGPV